MTNNYLCEKIGFLLCSMVLQMGIICENIIKILEGNFLKLYQNLDFLTQAFAYFSKIRAKSITGFYKP